MAESNVQRELIDAEFKTLAKRALAKELCDEAKDAMISALVMSPDISPTEREQRIGYYHGLLRAAMWAAETQERVAREDA